MRTKTWRRVRFMEVAWPRSGARTTMLDAEAKFGHPPPRVSVSNDRPPWYATAHPPSPGSEGRTAEDPHPNPFPGVPGEGAGHRCPRRSLPLSHLDAFLPISDPAPHGRCTASGLYLPRFRPRPLAGGAARRPFRPAEEGAGKGPPRPRPTESIASGSCCGSSRRWSSGGTCCGSGRSSTSTSGSRRRSPTGSSSCVDRHRAGDGLRLARPGPARAPGRAEEDEQDRDGGPPQQRRGPADEQVAAPAAPASTTSRRSPRSRSSRWTS